MFIGILQFELFIDAAQGLKDKRRVVKSIKDKLHREHMVAVSEVGAQETWNLALMGLVCCSADGAYLHGVLDAIVRKLEHWPDARLGNVQKDVVGADQIVPLTAEDGSPLWRAEERRED